MSQMGQPPTSGATRTHPKPATLGSQRETADLESATSLHRGKTSLEKNRRRKSRKEDNLLWPILITAIIIALIGLFIFVSRPPTR
jgi:hypothetical protein